MNTYEAITKRHACRAYTDEPLTAEETQKLIEAANAAPAGMGDYTGMKLTVVKDRKLIESIESATAHGMPMMGDHPVYEAPALMILSAKINEQFPMISYCNVSCAAENIMIQATDLGLASVFIMAVPTVMQNKPDLLKALNITDDFLPLVMVAVGHEKNKSEMLKSKRLSTDIL